MADIHFAATGGTFDGGITVLAGLGDDTIDANAMTQNVVMTGGVVAHNPYLVKMAEEMISRQVLVPEHPQLTGAIGAALYAMDSHK